MPNIPKLIMNLSKSQQIYRLTASRLLHGNFYAIPKAFHYEKLLKNTSHRIISVYVQPDLHFSNSTLLNSDIGTMAENNKKSRNVKYDDILKAQNDDNILIIDVRERDEIFETGKLPGSIHIPMGEVVNTLQSLSNKDFKEKFGREKPSKDSKIILSCNSGKRSAMVQDKIQALGYKNAYNYDGGWSDWETNQMGNI